MSRLPVPTVIDRVCWLQSAANVLREIGGEVDAHPDLDMLAHVIHENATALQAAVNAANVHEAPCPSVGGVNV